MQHKAFCYVIVLGDDEKENPLSFPVEIENESHQGNPVTINVSGTTFKTFEAAKAFIRKSVEKGNQRLALKTTNYLLGQYPGDTEMKRVIARWENARIVEVEISTSSRFIN